MFRWRIHPCYSRVEEQRTETLKQWKKKMLFLFLAIEPNEVKNCCFFGCLDENYVVAGQEFYFCPVDDHLLGKNRILAQLPYNV